MPAVNIGDKGGKQACGGSGSGGGAGIGSGQEVAGSGGEVETVIKITGGTVIAHSNSALAIGHGEDGSDKGAELYYDAKVTAGGSKEEATLQTTDNRAYGLTRRYAKIEPCGFLILLLRRLFSCASMQILCIFNT